MVDEQLLIAKNNAWIWKNVHAFSRKNVGYGSIQYDPDDLYQECVAYLISKFRRSGLSVDEFQISGVDLRHVMCEYVQSLLPVRIPKTVRRYSENMNRFQSEAQSDVSFLSDKRFIANNVVDECNFSFDVESFGKCLEPRDREILHLILLGYSWSDIARKFGENRMNMSRAKSRIGKRYNDFMRESHGCAKEEAPC